MVSKMARVPDMKPWSSPSHTVDTSQPRTRSCATVAYSRSAILAAHSSMVIGWPSLP
jgi:hypothetical protein